jgi:hypothetical protein
MEARGSDDKRLALATECGPSAELWRAKGLPDGYTFTHKPARMLSQRASLTQRSFQHARTQRAIPRGARTIARVAEVTQDTFEAEVLKVRSSVAPS